MASTKVQLPDGSEQNASEIICEDCEKPVSQHSCANGTTASGGGGVVVSRSTGPRKDPRARPQCPHCGGAVHFSMPGGLQNTECIMRQFYIDKGDIVDAYATLPLYGLDDLKLAIEWAASLRTPITYGRMDSAAGGAGTYASLRPKADKTADPTAGKRPKKQVAAQAGEKIEDIAATVVTVPEKPKRGRKPKIVATTASAPEAPAVVEAPAPPPVDLGAKQREAEERRAKRRALLGIGR